MKQVIAMHGWAGDASQWTDWQRAFAAKGWLWCNAERGYGEEHPIQPSWQPEANRRALICHSLGFHLVDATTLEAATDLVLLGSFSRFVPEGAAGRALRTGLKGMARQIGTSAEQTMLKQFLERVAAPLPLDALPGSLLRQGPSSRGRDRLRQDLQLLSRIEDLPPGCPRQAGVLVLQGDQDAIVIEPVRRQLLHHLNNHLLTPPCTPQLQGEGHALLITPQLQQLVIKWLAGE